MNEPSELDIAQLRVEMRTLYSHIGFIGSLQVLYEIMYSARVLAEVILEEKSKKGAD